MCPISDCFNGYCYNFFRKVSNHYLLNSQFTEKLNRLDETFLVTKLATFSWGGCWWDGQKVYNMVFFNKDLKRSGFDKVSFGNLLIFIHRHHPLVGGFGIFFYFHPYLGKVSILTNIFQRGWFNHQPDYHHPHRHHLCCIVQCSFNLLSLLFKWKNVVAANLSGSLANFQPQLGMDAPPGWDPRSPKKNHQNSR